jgi:branched-chain amino acid transport system substrate-binding protein
MLNKILILTTFFLTLLLCSACDRQKEIQASGKIIKLGIIAPFSGEDKAKGLDGIKGLKTAMAISPLAGNGDKIELIIEDDRNRPELTLSALHRLVTEQQVSAIILMSTSASALAIRAAANELQIPVLAMLATHPDVTKGSDYISQLCFDNVAQGTVAALFVMDELLLNKAAVFTNPESKNSTTLATEFINKYQSVGGVINNTVLVQAGVDYRKKLEDLRDNDTELLYLPLKAKSLIQIVKVAEEMDWHPEIMGSDGLVATVITDYQEDAKHLQGFYAIDFFSNNENLIENISFAQKLSDFYNSSYQDKGTSYTALGVESYMVVQNAMNRCQDPGNKICINRQLRNTRNFAGLTGKITINEEGKASRPIIVNTIKNGEMKFLVKVY